jgi:hypothetical protein
MPFAGIGLPIEEYNPAERDHAKDGVPQNMSLAKMSEFDRQLLLSFAEKMPHRRRKSASKA